MLESPAAIVPIMDFEGLLGNLDRQAALYERLLTLSEQERGAIERADITTLSRIISDKEHIVAEARQLESMRQSACQRWAHEWGMSEPPTISALRARIRTTELAERLDAAAIVLSASVNRLQQENTRNAHLIMQTQRMGARMISTAARHGHHPVYDAHGEATADRRLSLIFDYRA